MAMIAHRIRILLIEDDIIDQMAFQRLVREKNLPYDFEIAGSVKKAQEILSDNQFDVVIADYYLGDGTAFDIFELVADTPFIFTTGVGDEKIAVEAMKAGAYYYHIKDAERNYLEMLPVSIEKALNDKRLEQERRNAEEALKESEEKFRAISSAANDAIIMMDYDGNVSFLNSAAENIFDRKSADALGKNLHDMIVPPDSNKTYLKGLRYFWETGVETALGKTVEMTVLRSNGELFDIELSLSAVKIEKEMNTIAIIRDITERKQAEQALQESESRYRTLQENIPLGIYRSTKEGKFLSANPSMVKILGFSSQEELLATDADQIYADQLQHNKFINEIDSFDHVVNYELQLRKKSNQIFWAEINARAIRDEEGQIVYYDGILEDITVSKQAKEELRQNKERLDLILQNIGNGVMVTNAQQDIFVINNKIRELLGIYDFQIVGKKLPEILLNCKDKGKVLLDALPLSSFTNLELEIEFPLPRTLYVTGTSFTDVDGKSAGKIFIMVDVTKEKEIERMKTDFVSNVSHELRTPLTSIIGFSKTMLNNPAIGEQHRNEFLEIIYRESQRLSNLIEEVLSISRIESGKMEYNFQNISVAPIIKEVYNIHRLQAEKKHIRLSYNIDKKLPLIRADRDAIHQVAVNFVGNAIKFTNPGGNINIAVKNGGNKLIMEFSDNGLGIPKIHQGKIFDKFYRIARPGTETQGTGLGLSIVKEIIDAHKGKIELISEENKGTLFRVFLPALNY
ncbi:MAG: PAS domain S-box protein [Candidatus Cloacimonetes bacterium]|nr:PAS domain S-box protein [Candidatus Cloacimonadota bacterium]